MSDELARERLELEVEELALKRRRLALERQSLEEQELTAAARSRVSALVRLNVGGTYLETQRETLLAAGRLSYLAKLLDESHTHLTDDDGRIFIDRDARLFALVLQFLRGSLVRQTLSSTTCTELMVEAEFFGVERLVFWLHDEFDPVTLGAPDQRLRAQAEQAQRDLQLSGGAAGAAVDNDLLLSVLTQPDKFVFTGKLEPGTDSLLLLFQPLRSKHGRSPAQRLPVDVSLSEPASSSAQTRTEELLTVSSTARRYAMADDVRWDSLSWEQKFYGGREAHLLEAFRARFQLFSGPLLEGLDMKHLVVAGGSVLQAP